MRGRGLLKSTVRNDNLDEPITVLEVYKNERIKKRVNVVYNCRKIKKYYSERVSYCKILLC